MNQIKLAKNISGRKLKQGELVTDKEIEFMKSMKEDEIIIEGLLIKCPNCGRQMDFHYDIPIKFEDITNQIFWCQCGKKINITELSKPKLTLYFIN